MAGPLFAFSTGVLNRARSLPHREASPEDAASSSNQPSSASTSTITNGAATTATPSPASATDPVSSSEPSSAPSTANANPNAADRLRSPRIPLRRPSLPIKVGKPLSNLSIPSFPSLPSLSSANLADWPWGGMSTLTRDAREAQGSRPTPLTPNSTEVELLVIAHGLQGQAEDFNFVLRTLKASNAVKQGNLVIYPSSVNTDRTNDGVAAGGMRLADDIRKCLASRKINGLPTHRISLVGFSLGGLYVRYAAAELYNGDTGLMCGLTPASLIIAASPNLGVRRFGMYRFVPDAMRGVKVFGDTVREMMLMDDDCILERMSKDDDDDDVYDELTSDDDDNHQAHPYETEAVQKDATDATKGDLESGGRIGSGIQRKKKRRLLFVSAITAFEFRVLYANVRNDLMVNFGTAALEPGVCAVSGNDMERVMRDASKTECAVDETHDDKGCKICFQYWISDDDQQEDSNDHSQEQGFNKNNDPDNTSSSSSPDTNSTDQSDKRQQSHSQSRTHAHELITFRPRRRRRQDMNDDEQAEEERIREVVMAQRLRSIGWWVIGVDFPAALPIAHNRIVAMSRNIIHAWINAPGQRAVHHLVDTICQRFDAHGALFKRTNGDGDMVEHDKQEDEHDRVGDGQQVGGVGVGGGVGGGGGLHVALDMDADVKVGDGVGVQSGVVIAPPS